MLDTTNICVFLALVKAGLWEQDVRLSQYENIDFQKVYRLAEEQSVLGLVAAGLDHVIDIKPPIEVVLQFVGQALQIERQNQAMNIFIGDIIEKMRTAGIYTLLVKGQGIAQCYEKPLWRASGDIDLFLSKENYEKAKSFLLPLSSGNKPERQYSKEMGLIIRSWYVEIHGTQRTGLSKRVDCVVDSVQNDVFYGENVRSWMNEKTSIFLPAPDNDVFFVFTHFIKHFYNEGMNVRQVCDWCRLLWTYRESLNHGLLESRIKKAGLMSEWKAFAAVTVDYLGMPVKAMPMYADGKTWHKKANMIVNFIFNAKPINSVGDKLARVKVFPANTLMFLPAMLFHLNWLKVKERIVQ